MRISTRLMELGILTAECAPVLIIDPKNSSGVIIVAFIHGSSIDFIMVGSGRLDGFCKSITFPLFKFTL